MEEVHSLRMKKKTKNYTFILSEHFLSSDLIGTPSAPFIQKIKKRHITL